MDNELVSRRHSGCIARLSAGSARSEGEILEIMPGYSLATRLAASSFRDQWVEDKIMHGLRLAGLPEG